MYKAARRMEKPIKNADSSGQGHPRPKKIRKRKN